MALAGRTYVRYGGMMTAQGSPTSVLRRAIRGGSLGAVEMALIDVPQVDLQDALAILELMAEARDPRFASWARRWLDRVSAEEREQLQSLLDRLPGDANAAVTLRERAQSLRSVAPGARLRAP